MLKNLEYYKEMIVDFENRLGDKLTITTTGNNKYPTLGIQKKDSCFINKIGTVNNPEALIKFLRGEEQDEESKR